MRITFGSLGFGAETPASPPNLAFIVAIPKAPLVKFWAFVDYADSSVKLFTAEGFMKSTFLVFFLIFLVALMACQAQPSVEPTPVFSTTTQLPAPIITSTSPATDVSESPTAVQPSLTAIPTATETIMPSPTATPAPSATVIPLTYETWNACPDTYASRVRVGILAFVSHNPPLANRIRNGPDTEEEVLGMIDPGQAMRVIEGPYCAQNLVWWRVEVVDSGLIGWTAEGDSGAYWLDPCSPDGKACYLDAFANLPTPQPGPIAFYLPGEAGSLQSLFGWEPGPSPESVLRFDGDPLGVTLVAGPGTETWHTNLSAPLITYATHGNFEITVRIQSDLNKEFQFSGIGLRSAAKPDTWIRLGLHCCLAEGRHIGWQQSENQSSYEDAPETWPQFAENLVELKLVRQGDKLDAFYRRVGEDWLVMRQSYPFSLPDQVEIFLIAYTTESTGSLSVRFTNFVVRGLE
jgi:regulation of enolase protein 1 (concanavalin A-like superfamily)